MKASQVRKGDKLWFGGIAVDVRNVFPRGQDELTFMVTTDSGGGDITFHSRKDAELACRLREPRPIRRKKA